MTDLDRSGKGHDVPTVFVLPKFMRWMVYVTPTIVCYVAYVYTMNFNFILFLELQKDSNGEW